MKAAPLLLLVGLLLAVGPFAGDPDAVDIASRFAAPCALHPLGTDQLGRDLAARLITGAYSGLAIVALTGALSLLVGIGLGTTMRLAPIPLAAILRRAADLILAVPTLVVALAFSAILGATPVVIGIALSLGGIAATAHVTETLLVAASMQSHVMAAEALGGTPWHILRRHLLPEVAPALLLLQSYHAARALLSWSALTFLGFGGDTSRPDWGGMVWEYRLFLFDHPSLPLIPAFTIGILAWAAACIGEPARQSFAGRG